MAKIATPVEGFTGHVAGVAFENGIGETDSLAALAYFRRQGYTVVQDEAEEPALPEGDPSDKWTVGQLTAYAAAHGVDLGDAKKKDELLAALVPAE
ncbi:hypothetical protein F8O06_02750 [Pseudoclavibacter sp. CFCC 14310]|uniref:Ish1 domain-containing protein n=1 Tax=Pseudoclavibacter sp. CFCC 14310 TaxID=2615180 RepID=UPI0013016A96|nr:Ish1 domain-containing protein [Pseudoclavibacter sp. CFCC 14310]KAB1647476.1 hypothetical protein F8O06_02750 [Pseudoclavibacter sp. CFCC 14310]